jgi:hypothetical protein
VGEHDRVAVAGVDASVVGRAVGGQQRGAGGEILALPCGVGDEDAAGRLGGGLVVQAGGTRGGEDVLKHTGDAMDRASPCHPPKG